MEMSEMLDVLHYFMEEELSEDVDTVGAHRSRLRKHMYETLYQRDYKYFVTPKQQDLAAADSSDPYEDWGTPINVFDPTQEVKPFVPPTPVNPDSSQPFGNILGDSLN